MQSVSDDDVLVRDQWTMKTNRLLPQIHHTRFPVASP